MQLNFSLDFNNLNSLSGLHKTHQIFLNYLKDIDNKLYKELLNHTANSLNNSDFLLKLAIYVDDFIAELFFVEKENLELKKRQQDFNIIYECRRKFVQRVVKKYDGNEVIIPDDSKFHKMSQKVFAMQVMDWLQEPNLFRQNLQEASQYACYMVNANSDLPLFNIPRKLDQDNLIRTHKIDIFKKKPYIGFDYRDGEINLENALAQTKYCIYCHKQNKDSCRTGIKNDNKKTGCPLDQKISEMNKLFADGFNIGALAIIIIDNPLVAATGHRICNDCMKSCIFQKQDPVNIPLIESQILENVLALPYGVEIYLLLTKWNPLNIRYPLPKQPTNYNILVAGLGPAGFALSHYLLNEGHNIVAVDGLKIQPLDFDHQQPIKYWQKLKIALSKRSPKGFGGVAEYGITNRWDKNNLTLVRLILERRNNFKMIGSVRVGSNITIKQIFDLGFDYIAMCVGAKPPRYFNSNSYFLKGVKAAADFLMNLQQGGSFLSHSNSKMLIRMPAVVIGCGLTAIDSAVEIMHYYPTQVEIFLTTYENGQVDLAKLNAEESKIAKEMLLHAKLFRQAKSEHKKIDILQSLGGVSICYRGIIKDSAAYQRNHEEIEHAKAIGIKFIENVKPGNIIGDKNDYAKEIEFINSDNNIIILPAKTILVAIGTEKLKAIQANHIHENLSFFGDCNQRYSGSVVKALANAKDGYLAITKKITKNPPSFRKDFTKFGQYLSQQLEAKIYSVKEISSNMLELVVRSSMAAKNYQPGQIFRFQNIVKDTKNSTKPLALSPYEVNVRNGLIYFVVLKTGRSTTLCKNLKIGDSVALMGPVGFTTQFIAKKYLLIGYGIRNMALLPIANKIKQQNSEVVFLAHYDKKQDRIYENKIQLVADKIIWSCHNDLLKLSRDQDESLAGTITDNLAKIIDNELNDNTEIICYAPNQVLEQIKNKFSNLHMRCNLLLPMQCMMQGICGQCIQKVNNKDYIFGCACLESDICNFSPKNFINRLNQNSLFTKCL